MSTFRRTWLSVLCLSTLVAVSACSNQATAVAEQPAAGPISDGLTAHRIAVPGVSGLITAGHPLASMAGLRILMQGGNAADAAVAILSTLHQVEPMMSGAGGNGFATMYDKKTDTVYSLNATGAAPKALDPNDVTPEELNRGIKSGLVPGLFGGWIALLDRFGTMSLADVLQPALEYAENGHPLDPTVASALDRAAETFRQYPTTAAVFLPGGQPPVAGQLFKYPALAQTYRKVIEAERTAKAAGKSRSAALRAAFDRFYKGDIAQEMARFYQENGGYFTLEDFAAYEPIWAEPVHTTYRGYDVYTSPSTSRGGFEVAMQLNLIEGYDVASMGHNSARTLHLVSESIKVAKADIYHYVADPKFTEIPVAGMVSKEYAETRRALIQADRVMAYPDHGTPPGAQMTRQMARAAGPAFPDRAYDGSTTSFSVADKWGNVIALTPTLGGGFGTYVVAGNTGVLFNNGARIGSTSPYPDDVNYVRGGQIPLLNNSPIIVMKDGKFVLSLGSPGGETIGQTQFQALLNVLDFGMSIQEAVEAPRISLNAEPNFYMPGAEVTMSIEGRVSPQVVQELEAMGHRTRIVDEYSQGNMQGILVNQQTGTMTAGADARRTMYAVGF